MSISVYGLISTGAGKFAEAFDAGNYTGNCAAMWRAAISGTFESLPRGLKDLEGFQCAACEMILGEALLHMDDPTNRDRYLAMNPSTGFGDFESAREWLRKILAECRKHPLAFLHVIS